MNNCIEETKLEILPLSSDIMSKHIFGYQKHVIFLEDMLESMFNVSKGTYKGTEILNSVRVNKDNVYSKDFEMDILAKLPTGEIVNIEFYSKYDINSEIKSFMYVTRAFSSELDSGDNYILAKKFSQINIVRKNSIHKDDKLIKKYLVINEANKEDKILPDLFQVYIVDVDITKELDYNLDINEDFYKWSRFIAADTMEEMESIIRGNEIMEKVYEEMKRFSRQKWVASGLFPRERLIKSQHETELEEAREESLAVGIEQGILETAKNMLNKNYQPEDISEITNLSLEQIKKLKEELD